MSIRISNHLDPLCLFLKHGTHINVRIPNYSNRKQQEEYIGGSNRTSEFHKKIATKHMCFTVESGPRYAGTRTKTTSRAIFGKPLQKYFRVKTKSRRKARIFFHKFQTSAAVWAKADASEEEETIYIRSSMEEEEEEEDK